MNMKIQKCADDLNPKFVFALTDSRLLADLATGKINAQEWAKKEMASRGIDENLSWIGFDNAKKLWEKK